MRSKAIHLFSNHLHRQTVFSKHIFERPIYRAVTTTALKPSSNPRVSWRLWLGCISATGTVGLLAWYHYNNWYYMYPILSGDPIFIPPFIESMESHARLLEKLEAHGSVDTNKKVIIVGEQGAGKSIAVNCMLQPEGLKKWFIPNQFSNYVPRPLIPVYLRSRPWLIFHYKGLLENAQNSDFQEKFLSALRDTKEKYNVRETEKYSMGALLREMFWKALTLDSTVVDSVSLIFLRVATTISPIKLTEDYKNQRKKALLEFKMYLEEHPGWVIALDDIQSLEGIEEFLPTQGGTLIITTNDKNRLGYSKDDSIEFNGFTYDEAMHFLEKSLTQLVKDKQSMDRLINIFAIKSASGATQCNPLFLDQACRTINNMQISIEEYLNLLEEGDVKSIFGEDRGSHEHRSIYQSLGLVLSFFRNGAKTHYYGLTRPMCPQEKLLFILCNFNHIDAPQTLIKSIFCSLGDDSISFMKAKGSLLRYGLISENESGHLSMHPFFHKIFRDHLLSPLQKPPEYFAFWYMTLNHWMGYDTLIDYQLKVSDEKLKKEIESPSRITLMELNAGLQVMQTTVKQLNAIYYQQKNKISFLESLAESYLHTGNFLQGKLLFEQILAMSEQFFGKDSIEVAVLLNKLSEACCVCADDSMLPQIVLYLERTIKIGRLHSDENHVKALADALIIKSGLCLRFNSKDKIYEALQYSNDALDLQNKLTNPKNKDMASIKNQLGLCYLFFQDLQNTRIAIKYFKDALPLMLIEHPRGNSDIATILCNLGACYGRLGIENPEDLRTAITYHEQALQLRLKLLGSHHATIGSSYNSLAILHLTLGTKEALKQSLQYCDLALSISKPMSLDAAIFWNTKGVIHLTTNDRQYLDEAQDCFKSSIAIKEVLLHSKHPDCERSKFCLGVCYLIQENDIDGIALIIEALEVFKTNLTQTHTYVGKALQEFPRLKTILEKNSSSESIKCLQVIEAFECWANPTKQSCTEESLNASDAQCGFFKDNATLKPKTQETASPTNRM
ncbi:MAG: hypothetical protein CK423_08020 [Legionella sp.]|nr:MAG: hypothetical protein CK423_08020 [Legionella sp.]